MRSAGMALTGSAPRGREAEGLPRHGLPRPVSRRHLGIFVEEYAFLTIVRHTYAVVALTCGHVPYFHQLYLSRRRQYGQ